MHSRTNQRAVSIAVVLATALPAFAANGLTGLGRLATSGDAYSAATAVSADGSAALALDRNGSIFANSGTHFHWRSGTRTPISFPIWETIVADLSADGNTVAGVYDATAPFLWTASGGGRPLPRPGNYLFAPTGVSGDGTTVVGNARDYNYGLPPRVARWTAATGTVLLATGGTNDTANGVSLDGSTTVGHTGYVACQWTAGGFASLSDLPGGSTFSVAYAANADGSVVVGSGSSANGSEAVRWTNSVPIGLGDLPGGGFSSSASAVNADGTVVAGTGTSALGSEAAVFSAGGVARLWDLLLAGGIDPAAGGWTNLYTIADVSADGQTFVGNGMRNGRREAFIATIPEPGLIAVVAGIVPTLCLRRRPRAE